jgi:cytochrome c biogenesis factor
MWGTWFTVTFAGIGVIVGVIAFATFAAPLFAVAIILLILGVISIFMSGRRQQSDPSSPQEAKARSEDILARGPDAETAGTQPRRSGGAPASGEGT